MTHPGVGPITGLVYILASVTPERFPSGKKIGCYTGLIPSEHSSAGLQRLVNISKQGNSLLRFWLGESAQAAVCVTRTGGVGMCTCRCEMSGLRVNQDLALGQSLFVDLPAAPT